MYFNPSLIALVPPAVIFQVLFGFLHATVVTKPQRMGQDVILGFFPNWRTKRDHAIPLNKGTENESRVSGNRQNLYL